MEQAGNRIGQTRCGSHAGIDVLLEHEADEGGQQVRHPHREQEGQHVTERDADGSTLQIHGQDARAKGEGRVQQAHVASQTGHPAGRGQPDQHAVGALFQKVAMVLNHLQQPQRPDAEGERHNPA